MSLLPPNLAIVGVMHSGKSTVAEYLIERYGYTRLSFAGPLKEKALDMLNAGNFRPEPFTQAEIDAHKSVFRPFLQWVGTELGREYVGDENYWVDQLEARMRPLSGPFVIDDARFESEWVMLKDQSFQFAYVERPEAFRYQTYASLNPTLAPAELTANFTKHMQHPSEPDLPRLLASVGEAWLIRNDSMSSDPLFREVRNIVDRRMGTRAYLTPEGQLDTYGLHGLEWTVGGAYAAT
jgi:hypothetical protein